MKKIITFMLSLMVAASMSVPVFAQSPEGENITEPDTIQAAETVSADTVGAMAETDPSQTDPPAGPVTPSTEPTTTPVTQPATTAPKPVKLTSADALNIALKNAKLSKSKVKWIDVELERGLYEVEFTKKSGGTEYDYTIAQSNGKILKKSVEYKYKKSKSKKKIGKTKARKKAAKFAKVPYSAVKKGRCKLERDGGVRKYEINFSYKGYKYEMELLAKNGKVIEYSWKR